MTCIGEPISWLRLERHALAADPLVEDHLASCEVCRACLAEIRGDVVALPPLVIAQRRRVMWWWWLAPAVAAAAIALVIIRPRDPARDDIARIKGVGEIVLGAIRERDGVIRDDARTFRPGDRWKVVVTCPPQARVHPIVDIAVVEAGASATDYPVAPAEVACGNRVVVPGAFALTGTRPHRICVRVAGDVAPPRALPRPGDDGVACLTVEPE